MFAIVQHFKNQSIQLWLLLFIFVSPGEAIISLDKFKYLFSTTNLY